MGKRPPKKMETAMTRFNEAANLRGDEIVAVAPLACEAIVPSERRPVAIAGRVIDMTTVEALAKIGLTYEEVLRKLRLKQSDLLDRPDVESEIREACDAGNVDLIYGLKENLVQLAAKNPVSNIFALKTYGGDQFDEKARRDKTKQTGQNAQEMLNGVLSILIERERMRTQEIQDAIAEQRALTQANMDAIQRQRMPRLGERNEATGKPVVSVEPTTCIDAELDETEHQSKRVQLTDTSAAEALQKTIAQRAAQVTPNETD